ncbi:adenylosuccinase ade13 [Purpureocillium lilacinum]|nr:adenylosuccinase ade13 [Purpureocillium lilacinum]
MSAFDEYQTPLVSRYTSSEMRKIFTPRQRYTTWRQLWLWLAEAEQELGVDKISNEALDAIRANLVVSDEAFKVAADEEKRVRHDVMAHIHALEKDAPAAAGVVTDNADLIFLRDAMDLLLPKLARAISSLAKFAVQYKDLPTLGFTHYQAAQPITLGRRAAQWLQDLVFDLEDIEYVRSGLKFRGAQGTTGTQASFLALFQNDASKVDQLNEKLCAKSGFQGCYDISTQTYTRKVDLRVANALAALGATATRVATDIRHLCHDKVLDEPHVAGQIGSSAMPFKSNPMTAERICSLGRKLSNISSNFSETFSSQWLERSLDDSAIRRMDIPEMFFLADAIVTSLDHVCDGLVVFPAVINSQLMQELPYMASEEILIRMVNHGASRQVAHEEIRLLSREAAYHVKMEGGSNDLIERIKRTEFFKPIWGEVDGLMDARLFIGRCAEQVERYAGAGGVVDKHLQKYQQYIQSSKTTQLAV